MPSYGSQIPRNSEFRKLARYDIPRSEPLFAWNTNSI
jgi:hypothetical protein